MSSSDIHPKRRSIRLQDFDYAQRGFYFLTICAHQMHSLFGKLENNVVRLNVIGRIALDCWRDIPNHFSRVELHPFVIMPNHVHGILGFNDDPLEIEDGHGCPVPLPYRRRERFQRPTAGSLPTIVRSYKGSVSYLARQSLGRPALRIWQSNYFERALRNADEFSNARRYIFENPGRGTGHPCPSSPQFTTHNPQPSSVPFSSAPLKTR